MELEKTQHAVSFSAPKRHKRKKSDPNIFVDGDDNKLDQQLLNHNQYVTLVKHP